MGRALGNLAPLVPGFSDPVAVHFLREKWRRRVERTRASLASGARTSPYPFWQGPLGTYLQFRTVILDRALASSLPVEQLVILGAGLDSRAWRLDSLRNTIVFEADFPSSQAWKLERAASVPHKAKWVRFVAIDFERDQLAPLLRAAGFDQTKPTFWIWEGVTMYLRPKAVSANLGAMAALSAHGSRIAFTYLQKKNGRMPRSLVLALMGEPLRSAFSPVEITDLARSHGWNRIQDSNVQDWLKENPGLTLTRRRIGLQWLESIWVGEIA
jgi:methyltransferase (TIGR00027 family)